MKVKGSVKHSSLFRFGNNYDRKSFIIQAPWVAYQKSNQAFLGKLIEAKVSLP